MQNGRLGYWFGDAGLGQSRRACEKNIDVDVLIVGAGFSGLWAAYYLRKADPSLNIAILESEFVGFGASGRNGGHLTHGMPGLERLYLKKNSQQRVNEFQVEINRTIDEVVRVASQEGIDADIIKGGSTTVALNPAQLERVRSALKGQKKPEHGGLEYEYLSPIRLTEDVNMHGAIGGIWTPHSARVQPAKLAKGLGDVVEKMGVDIYEGSRVEVIEPGRVTLDTGVQATARYVIRATEGFTPAIAGKKRDWLPKLSPQIITEPLSENLIREIWPSNSMSNDMGHMFCYLQKTADNRIAIGGPGVPYYWGSRTDTQGITEQSSIRDLTTKLHTFFPQLREAQITHAWTGVLGVPRDWSATVSLDLYTGLGIVGGYVGSGVTGTNLAGRTMAELITGQRSSLSDLPWVNKRIRNWEIEPVRWIALRGLYKAYVLADRLEAATQSKRTSAIAMLSNRISGRY